MMHLFLQFYSYSKDLSIFSKQNWIRLKLIFNLCLEHFGCFTACSTLIIVDVYIVVVFLFRIFRFVACFARVVISTSCAMILVRFWLAFLNQFQGFPVSLFPIQALILTPIPIVLVMYWLLFLNQILILICINISIQFMFQIIWGKKLERIFREKNSYSILFH